MRPDNSQSDPLVVVVGPTGVGKSAVGVRVAEWLGGEVVGCDALQVYRGFDAGTAKPDDDQRRRVPHHLVDVLAPDETCSVGRYVEMADEAIADIRRRGAVPVVVGGSGMYLRGLLRGVVSAPPRDAELLRRLKAIVARGGSPRLHRWLRRLDPETAERLAPADGQRIVRALELALVTDAPLSRRLERDGTWSAGGTAADRYPSVKVGLDMDRELLRKRLAARVDGFYRDGLVEEVRRLLAAVPRDAGAFQAIGYREVVNALESGRDPTEERERICRNTRRYAKRQRTWFRKEPGIEWLDAAGNPDETAAQIVRRCRKFDMVYSPPPIGEGRDRS